MKIFCEFGKKSRRFLKRPPFGKGGLGDGDADCHTSDIGHWFAMTHCPQEGKSAKRRQWRMKQAGFEEVPRLAGTAVPGNRAARRWAREPLPYAGHDTLAKGGVVVIGRRAGGQPALPYKIRTPGPPISSAGRDTVYT